MLNGFCPPGACLDVVSNAEVDEVWICVDPDLQVQFAVCLDLCKFRDHYVAGSGAAEQAPLLSGPGGISGDCGPSVKFGWCVGVCSAVVDIASVIG